MPQVYEAFESQLGDGSVIRSIWIAQGYSSEHLAIGAVVNQVDQSISRNGLNYNLDATEVELIEKFTNDTWKVLVPYKSGIPSGSKNDPSQYNPPVGEWVFEFDTTGATKRQTNVEVEGPGGLLTSVYDSAGYNDNESVEWRGAINVVNTGDQMEVRGTDIVIPKLRFIAKATMPEGRISLRYAKDVARLTGTVNSVAFPPANMPFVGSDQFEIGEVLFLGANLVYRPGVELQVSLHFDCSENVSNLSVGDIVQIEKKGHEFIWYRYRMKDKTTSKLTVLDRDWETFSEQSKCRET